ncbi:MAG: hypothetical protein NTY01_11055, partial [Verrucomicrobia bacterium]|nr:hypothetical protein [Verrucomicrobiota bacterium]
QDRLAPVSFSQNPNLVFRRIPLAFHLGPFSSPRLTHHLARKSEVTSNGRRISWECQSGLDLRLLNQERALLLRASRMLNPRIAWDGGYGQWPHVRRAVNMLKKVGYGRKDIFVFMIYNHAIPYREMRKKLDACRRWRVRVIDCRYRPLSSTKDGYVPGPKRQTEGEYYIHPSWTDAQVRGFRRAVRRQNIAILLDLPNGHYLAGCETRKV